MNLDLVIFWSGWATLLLGVLFCVEYYVYAEFKVFYDLKTVIGGAGAEVSRFIDTLAARPRVLRLGLPDRFIDHGDQAKLLASVGLDEAGILASIASVNQADS